MAEHNELSGVVVAEDHHVEVLDPDEPKTPNWLPLLGAVLFLCAAIGFVATRPAGKTTDQLRKEAAAAAEKIAKEKAALAAAAAPPAPVPGPGEGQPAPARPPGKGG
jgi:hypothetical protein